MSKINFLLIFFTSNNIFFTLVNNKGIILFWKTLGLYKVKGLKKLTQSFIKSLINDFMNFLIINNYFLKIQFHLKLKGLNKLKKSFTKNLLQTFNKKILSISDETKNPFNGCKSSKKRRL